MIIVPLDTEQTRYSFSGYRVGLKSKNHAKSKNETKQSAKYFFLPTTQKMTPSVCLFLYANSKAASVYYVIKNCYCLLLMDNPHCFMPENFKILRIFSPFCFCSFFCHAGIGSENIEE